MYSPVLANIEASFKPFLTSMKAAVSDKILPSLVCVYVCVWGDVGVCASCTDIYYLIQYIFYYSLLVLFVSVCLLEN